MAPPNRQQLLADLRRAFPRQTVDAGTIQVYHRELADIPADVLETTVRAIIRTAEWFPTIAEIRAAAVERMLALPDEASALAQIDARMAWARLGEDTRGDRPDVHPVVRSCVEYVGGYHAFRTTDEGGRLRAQFARAYREARAAAIHDRQVGDVTAAPTVS